MSEIYIHGVSNIISRAKIFLTELKEFAPFGIIYKNNEWIDLVTYDEKLDSTTMRDFLINTIIKDFEERNTSFGAVCIDAKIKDLGDVIIIYNTSNGKDWYELVYKYSFDDGETVKILEENIEY